MAAQLDLEAEPPEYDERTGFWLSAFRVLHRTRPPSMGGPANINPVTVLDMAERLRWPCEPDEALSVIMAMDDAYVEFEGAGKTG